jgi:hypothetical protein
MLNFRMTQKYSCYAAMLVALAIVLAAAACSQQSGAIIKVDLKKVTSKNGTSLATTFDRLEFFFATQTVSPKRLTTNYDNFSIRNGEQIVTLRNFQAQSDVLTSQQLTGVGDAYELLLSSALESQFLVVVGTLPDGSHAVATINAKVASDTLRIYPLVLQQTSDLQFFGGDPSNGLCLMWNPPDADSTIFVVRENNLDCDEKLNEKCDSLIYTSSIPKSNEVCDGFETDGECNQAAEVDSTACIQLDRSDACVVGDNSFCNDNRPDPWTCKSAQDPPICVSKQFCPPKDTLVLMPGKKVDPPKLSSALEMAIDQQLEVDAIVCPVLDAAGLVCSATFEISRLTRADCGEWPPDLQGKVELENGGGGDDICRWKILVPKLPMEFMSRLLVTTSDGKHRRPNLVHFDGVDDCITTGGQAVVCRSAFDRNPSLMNTCD